MTIFHHTPSRYSVRHWPWAACACLLALIGGWLLLTLDPSMAWGGDNAMYMMLARNLATGVPYDVTGYVQNAFSYLAPQTYPPVFPLLLAPVYALFGLNIVVFKLYMVAVYLAALALLAGLSRDMFRDRPMGTFYWLALIPLIGLSPRLSDWARLILSDAAFLGWCAASLWMCRRAYRQYDTGVTSAHWQSLLAGLLIALAIGTRIIGVTLIMSVVVFEASCYRRITRVGLVAVAVALLAWLAQTLAVDYISQAATGSVSANAGQGYLYVFRQDLFNHLSEMPETALHNLYFYGRVLGQFWYGQTLDLSPLIRWALAASLAIALWGVVRQARTRYTVLEVFCVVYFLAILPWHAYGTRYLVPVIPFYFLYLLLGLQSIAQMLHPRLAPTLLLLPVLAIAGAGYGASAWANANFAHTIDSSAPNGAAANQVYEHIRRETPDNALIVTRDPRMLALFTSRRAVTYADRATMYRLRNETRLIRYFDDIGATYMLASPFDPHRAAKWLAIHRPDRFVPLFEAQSFTLYQLLPTTASGSR